MLHYRVTIRSIDVEIMKRGAMWLILATPAAAADPTWLNGGEAAGLVASLLEGYSAERVRREFGLPNSLAPGELYSSNTMLLFVTHASLALFIQDIPQRIFTIRS